MRWDLKRLLRYTAECHGENVWKSVGVCRSYVLENSGSGTFIGTQWSGFIAQPRRVVLWLRLKAVLLPLYLLSDVYLRVCIRLASQQLVIVNRIKSKWGKCSNASR